jgi:putative oxidoreductase
MPMRMGGRACERARPFGVRRGRNAIETAIERGYGFDLHSVFPVWRRVALNSVQSQSPNEDRPMSLIELLSNGRALAERIPASAVALLSRIAVASVFWRSGQTKVSGFHIREETFVLFREEYRVPLLPPDLAAYLSTIAEHVFPVLLVVGFATRLSALGLLGMTTVIQLFVYPTGWPEHILWFALLLGIIARGPGAISLDHLVWTRATPAPLLAR